NIYFTGKTNSTNFPTSPSVYDRTQNGSYDPYILKIGTTGAIVAGTFFGGGGDDIGHSIAVDASSNVYVGGETNSSNFSVFPVPTQANGQQKPFDHIYNGGADGFISKFNASLSTLTFSTYFGGASDDRIKAIALGPNDVVLFAGETNSTDFPTGNVNGGAKSGGLDIFAGQLDRPGKVLSFSWLVGGSGAENVKTAVIDNEGSYYIVGTTNSSNFPTTIEAEKKSLTGTNDAFIMRLNSNGIQNSRLFGGNQTDLISGVTLDSRKHLYFVGNTTSSNLPVSETAFQKTFSGTGDAFLAKEVFASIDMVSPLGNERWCGGSQQTLQWTPTGLDNIESYAIYVSGGESLPWQKIDSNISLSNYKWTIPTNLPTGNQYVIRIVGSSGLMKQSNTFTISQGPVINTQPEPVSICEGQSLTLQVGVTGVTPSYQWMKNGEVIAGANSATYSVPNATSNHSGIYSVRINGVCSSTPVISQNANVAVNAATKITAAPIPVNTTVGQQISLSVMVSGVNNSFQWQKNMRDIPDATSSSYSIASASTSDAGMYRVLVNGACGADTSEEIQVTVNTTSVENSETADGSLKIFSVSPNPASNDAILSFASTKDQPVSVWVSDIHGVKMMDIFLGVVNGNKTLPFETSSIPAGSYYVVAEQNGRQVFYNLRIVR
ncbi:MAG TPA: SBBP repeat-containing protein, partial [Patescibacteria group bacterium]|nr:SBBP repeat-containing protein [Patescibacteria group bacterium]